LACGLGPESLRPSDRRKQDAAAGRSVGGAEWESGAEPAVTGRAFKPAGKWPMTDRAKGRTSMRFRAWLALAGIVGLSACSPEADRTSARAPLTEHQRDSVLATSGVPGATVVDKAMAASDSVAAHAARMNSMSR
jgi:hypothetical protein